MGQKVNPVGFRLGIYRDWNSRWFASNKDYATFLNEDLKIRAYLEANLKDAQLSHTEIERVKTDKGTKVTVIVFVGRPGVVYGQDGVRIDKIKKDLDKVVKSGTLTIDVSEVRNPNPNAKLVAMSIAKQLEERASFRIAQKRAIQNVRKAGAKGVRTLVSGRLNGAEIARSEGYKEGTIPLHTLRSDIDYAQVEAHTTYGRLGVKVWICRGDYRPETEENRGKGE